MRILALLPILADDALESETRRELSRIANPNVEYTVRSLEAGPASVETGVDDRVAPPLVLDQGVPGARGGVGAVFVGCVGGGGAERGPEVVRDPVGGPHP